MLRCLMGSYSECMLFLTESNHKKWETRNQKLIYCSNKLNCDDDDLECNSLSSKMTMSQSGL